MKTTLIVLQNDADHAQAKALIEKLMNSKDPADQARMVAQAYLTEAYERSRWPRCAPSLPDWFHIPADLLIPPFRPSEVVA
ncbi:hypothetical protein [Peristeroidobacter soli]|jgi:HTH-type transcriptional regulator/antitoxin HigA|uniref:hypothetical protein n=1 Tax=Peristeroidobacter soli TaxID=2497877 RepID=UPI001C379473|nr:hypothetical protein [Peristeroidobacter soli]